MGNFYKDNEDLRFYVEKGIDWKPLVELTEYGYRDPEGFSNAEEAVSFYQDTLEMLGEFAAAEIAPLARVIDAKGLEFVDGEVVHPKEVEELFAKIGELGLHGMCLPRQLDGMNMPLLTYFINTELMGRADVSTMAHHSFHGGMAMAMLIFSIREGSTRIDLDTGRILETRFEKAIAEIARGKAWGCMDITEPNAGSDMAALRAVGEQDADGNWFVTGEKIFVTSGHGKYHFVIARTEKPESDPAEPLAGLRGLSLFLVPTYEEDDAGNRRRIVPITRLEEKLGHHGSATCALHFDRAPAFLIGERGEGFRHMLLLMNNARVGVGFECLGLLEAAHRLAADYASQRESMGKTIDQHELIADYLDEMKTDIQGIRALTMYGAYHEEMGQKLRLRALLTKPDHEEQKRIDKAQRRHAARSRRVTPLIKYLAAEKAVEMTRRCLQIHGGNGYMTEYGAEKLVRDAMVMPIYEGTSQIQALMAMRDTMNGILKNPRRFVRRVAQARWRSLSSRDPLERQLGRVQTLSLTAQQHLLAKTAGDKFRSLREKPLNEWPERFLKNWDPKRDFAFALLHAERLSRLLADEAICAVLWKQAEKHPERRELLERYAERALPRCRALHEEITSTGQRLLASLGRAPAPDVQAPAAE